MPVSLADAIAEHAVAAVDDAADLWLEAAVDSSREAIATRRREVRAQALPVDVTARRHQGDELALLDHATQGVAAVERGARLLGRLGRAKATGVLIHLAAGREQDARRVYLAHGATLAERLAASEASTVATLEAARAREQAWDELAQIVLEVGLLALRAALPFLLAAL